MVSKMQLLHNHAQRGDPASPVVTELLDNETPSLFKFPQVQAPALLHGECEV
jgi:hypothetical protein